MQYQWVGLLPTMAERQQRQRLRVLRNDRNLARFVVEGRATGKQLGTGSYGSVEEVIKQEPNIKPTSATQG